MSVQKDTANPLSHHVMASSNILSFMQARAPITIKEKREKLLQYFPKLPSTVYDLIDSLCTMGWSCTFFGFRSQIPKTFRQIFQNFCGYFENYVWFMLEGAFCGSTFSVSRLENRNWWILVCLGKVSLYTWRTWFYRFYLRSVTEVQVFPIF